MLILIAVFVLVAMAGVVRMAVSGDRPIAQAREVDGAGSAAPQQYVAPVAPAPAVVPPGPRTGPLRTGPNVHRGEHPPVPEPSMSTRTPAGALAAAVYFIRAVDWSIATNDGYLVKQLALPSCRACKGYLEQFAELRRTGSVLQDGRWAVTGVSIVNGASPVKSDYVFRVDVDQAGATLFTPGTAPTRLPAQHGVAYYVFVSWVKGHWRVVEQTV